VRDHDYSTSVDFLNGLFGETVQQVELRAAPNIKGEPGARSLFSREPAEIAAFCARKDEPGMSVYFGVCTRQDGATSGNLSAVAECPALWVDIDCVKQGLKGQIVIDTLEYLPFPPTIIVNSGGGLHAYWQLEQPVDVSEGLAARDVVTAALRALVHILAGDRKCAELARIMRLPGTHNSKDGTLELYDGKPALCEVISSNGRVHDFEELCHWLSSQRTLLHGREEAPRPLNEADPFITYAKEAGYEPAIDIDAALAAMEYGANGENSIHLTQVRVTYSMIARGYDDNEIVDRILAATERAKPRNTKEWDWNAEEKAIRQDIARSRKKQAAAPSRLRSSPVPATDGNAALAVVHDIQEEREKRAPKQDPEQKKLDEISALGTAVLGVWQERYGPIIHSRGTTYAYEGGVWSVWDEQHDQMLRVMLQEACVSLGRAPKTSLLGAATVYFMNRPSLLVRDVEFDQHGLIVAEDGVLDLRTLEIGPHSPDHRAMFRVGANLQGPRECPAFIAFLEQSFADKDPEEVPQIIRTLQEWFGACLVANKSRALAKGLFVFGGSRTGKTQLSEVLRALLGRNQTSATSAADIGTDFGLQPFLGKRGWVADDAIGQNEYLDAERYKKIVTGEEIGVRRKNRTDVMARFGFPVMLTANHLPRVKDQSDAVYNRSLILPMTNVRPETMPEPPGYSSIAAKIVAEELTGVLWWAIEGWQRLSSRGVFVEPPCMKKAVGELQDRNNAVRAWMRECAVEDAGFKVSKPDLFASFAGWYYLENGDGKFPWSQNGFTRAVTDMMPNLGSQTGAKTRNLTGIRLTESGLEYWSINSSRDSRDVPKGAAIDQYSVNQEYSISHAVRALKQAPTHSENDRSPRF
jgi:P4 family phage/plasmid primase-like protien